MRISRTPVTDAEIRAHEAAMAGRILDDEAPRRQTKAATVLARMAETMREIGEGCTDKELKRAGFSQAEIDRYGEQASDRAALKSRLN